MLTSFRTPQTRPPHLHGVTRRAVLQAGLAAGVPRSAWPRRHPAMVWGAAAGQLKRGGIRSRRCPCTGGEGAGVHVLCAIGMGE
jgi:hypothetical protein